ncbi:MAG: FG-GAP-like repeat-containing protein [Pirellulaceae bacterium]
MSQAKVRRELSSFGVWFAGHYRPWIAFLLIVGAAVCLRPTLLPDAQTRLLRRATNAWVSQDFGEAERLSLAVVEQSAESAPALLLAGQASLKNGHSERALEYFQRVSADSPAEYVQAQYEAGLRLFHLGRAGEAEQCLRRALQVNPQHLRANERLAVLLQIEGRTWEALPYAQTLIRSGQCGRDELLMVGGFDSMLIDSPSFIENCLREVPDDPIVLLGRGRLALLRKDDAKQAETIFRSILARHPEQIEALARLGELLLEKPERAPFLRWQASLPKVADLHPRTWYARGVWAQRNGQPRAAVRCFVEALRLHPNHVSSNFQLSQVLISLGMPEAATPFVERARLLSKLDFTLSQLQSLPDLELMRQVAEMNEQLGGVWESMGWSNVALLLDPETTWARQRLTRSNHRSIASDNFILVEFQPALAFDISEYPLPVWPAPDEQESQADTQSAVDGNVQLIDVAQESGISFQYFNGTTRTYGPDHIMTAPGGGMGVIDYDCDGWPDLYFAQAGPWDQRGDQNTYLDRLFRNLGDGRFVDVTEQAGLREGNFSGGIAVGDYNDDGFPDIYVLNIGESRLFENMCDGTFRDVTEAAGCGGDDDKWSTSGVIVDLNGDGFPEIYSVNYVLLDEALAKDCGQKGKAMGCAPTLFHAKQDRLFLNLGNGRFEDVTEECGIVVPDGKGLAVVAADFSGTGHMDLFVANDTTPDFYFSNQVQRPGEPLCFVERGVELGLAMNAAGQSQASMGLTLGDANGDQLLDVYIGTFYHDSNTLFLQDIANTFSDETRSAGLREPTFKMLTFGAQFVDADLDGWLDLVQANGHVDRSYDPSVPDLMRPQFFKNRGDGQFVELTSESLGPYFQQQYLGRAVAIVDFDRDGKPDVCVSHLDVPAALLANRSPNAGHYLAVTLYGRTCSRDAFGATILLEAGGRTWTRPLSAGGGYMATNEKKTIFGLGNSERVQRLEIRWPSGAVQAFEDLAVDQELLVVEGVSQWFSQVR